jgi:hypothetical protein
MKLVSMKRADDEDCDCIPWSSPNFGYGLSIDLNEAQCEALGITKAMAAGSKVSLQALGIVTSTNERVTSEPGATGTQLSICIQMTDVGVQQQGKASNAAAILFGGNDAA